jgi:hypothetical protein
MSKKSSFSGFSSSSSSSSGCSRKHDKKSSSSSYSSKSSSSSSSCSSDDESVCCEAFTPEQRRIIAHAVNESRSLALEASAVPLVQVRELECAFRCLREQQDCRFVQIEQQVCCLQQQLCWLQNVVQGNTCQFGTLLTDVCLRLDQVWCALNFQNERDVCAANQLANAGAFLAGRLAILEKENNVRNALAARAQLAPIDTPQIDNGDNDRAPLVKLAAGINALENGPIGCGVGPFAGPIGCGVGPFAGPGPIGCGVGPIGCGVGPIGCGVGPFPGPACGSPVFRGGCGLAGAAERAVLREALY